ncbi:MAG: hypothetical protein QOF27_13, partial [Gaiellaceae bacterium]|nr:hypothetical protein [Gaiellaceae bacterium]
MLFVNASSTFALKIERDATVCSTCADFLNSVEEVDGIFEPYDG